MDDQPMQGPAPAKKTLTETVALCLREDINIPYNLMDKVELRQPPINGDDHDSWAGSGPQENWLYVAQSIIRTIDRYRANHD